MTLIQVPAGLLPGGGGTAAVLQETFKPVPVVIVAFDELSVASLMNLDGGIDGRLFPNFASLQRDSMWFRNTTTVSGFTDEALGAFLTGKLQKEGFSSENNLFTLLGGAYQVRTTEEPAVRCPLEICRPRHPTGARLGKSFGLFATGARGVDLASFLGLIQAGTGPSLYYTHLIMPHSPWRYLPSGQRYPERDWKPGEMDPPVRGRSWESDPWLVTQVYQRHLLQVRLADRMLGSIVHRLREAHLYDEALVVVVSDHGVAFEPGMYKRWLVPETIGHVAAVPFFMKVPHGRRIGISDEPVALTDALPTIADVLNLGTLWTDLDGHSALDGSIPPDRIRTVQDLKVDPRGMEKYEVVERKYETFGRNGASLDLWRAGPARSERLLDRRVRTLNVGAHATKSLRVPRLSRYRHADPQDSLFPALLQGSIRKTGAGHPRIVAVSVNGRIAAVTRTYRERARTHFYCMLPPAAFHKPPNELDFFVVKEAPPATLRPLSFEGPGTPRGR